MSDYIPEPWMFALLGLASWRVWLLISDDKILEKPMDALLRRLHPIERRTFWREFIECPRCLGSWIALAWWLAWLAFPTETTICAVPWALFALVALVEVARSALAD